MSAARARTEEFAPGFRVSSIAHLLNRLHPDVVKTLDLESHGLEMTRADFVPSVALSKDGPPLVLHGAYGEVLTGASSSEHSAWKELRAQLLRYAGILKPFLARRPPDLGGMSLAETRSARPDRAGAEEARQGRHARFPARAADECRRPARRAACRRSAEGPARLRRDARQPSRPALADLAARSLLSAGGREPAALPAHRCCRRAAWARSSPPSAHRRKRPA